MIGVENKTMTEIVDRESLLPAPRISEEPVLLDRDTLVEQELLLLENGFKDLAHRIMWFERHFAETKDRYTTGIVKPMIMGPVLDEEYRTQRRYWELLTEADDGSWAFY
ncbi:MAG TPA: hypothetical protein VHB51_01065 [Candidatus Saccharimonadales bacterium]|nr:hypothetical protein [Candidatus Saccharimonadales bacterium]